MVLRIYLFTLYLGLILSAGLGIFIVYNVNPFRSPFWIISLFYLAVFLFFTAFFSLIFFYLKVWATNREVIFALLLPSLRQAMFIALAIIGLLFLQQIQVLNWWVAILFVLAMAMIELFFRSKKINIRGTI